jgi:hypothetical protein
MALIAPGRSFLPRFVTIQTEVMEAVPLDFTLLLFMANFTVPEAILVLLVGKGDVAVFCREFDGIGGKRYP